jgi:hypothetical protein
MMGVGNWKDRYKDLQVAGIVFQNPLRDLGVDQYPVEERRGHGCRLGRMEDFFKISGQPGRKSITIGRVYRGP